VSDCCVTQKVRFW